MSAILSDGRVDSRMSSERVQSADVTRESESVRRETSGVCHVTCVMTTVMIDEVCAERCQDQLKMKRAMSRAAGVALALAAAEKSWKNVQ